MPLDEELQENFGLMTWSVLEKRTPLTSAATDHGAETIVFHTTRLEQSVKSTWMTWLLNLYPQKPVERYHFVSIAIIFNLYVKSEC